MLELKEVTFAYPGQTETYVFSLKVAPGEIVSISGTSGSGKSTLLDLVAGYQTPSRGAISLNGKPIQLLRPEQRPVAIVFQDNNIFGHLSAGTNLSLAIPHMNKREKEEHIQSALNAVGLGSFANHRANDLSGGQKQRVALARTLLLDRAILLMDEPFTALDAKAAAEMRLLVKKLVLQNNWRTILVSHHADDHAMADQNFLLERGQLRPV